MQHTRLEHQFVEHLPQRLEAGVLYISIEYATAAHSCCCGCGEEVVTPFTPTDWKMTFDGDTISLFPSIGNWNMACRSHYFVERNRVKEALHWTNEEIAMGRKKNEEVKETFYGPPKDNRIEQAPEISSPARDEIPSLWSRLKRWLI